MKQRAMGGGPMDVGNVQAAMGKNLLASNQPVPMASFDQMPSPLARGPSDDDPTQMPAPMSGPAQMPGKGPATVPMMKPAPMSGGGDDELNLDNEPDAPQKKRGSLDKLQLTQDDYDNASAAKRRDIALGGIGDALANRQSFGNFFLGHMDQHHDVAGGFNKLAALEDAPIEQKKALLKQALDKPTQDFAMASADPTSSVSGMMGSIMKASIQNNTSLTDAQKADEMKVIGGKSATELNAIAADPLYKDALADNKLFQTMSTRVAVAEAKSDATMALYRAKQGDRASANGDTGSNPGQDKVMARVQPLLESARGNPAVAQAEKDRYAAQKANTLVGMYGDPNNMPQSQVNLLVQEVGKIASGGTPAMHELDGISPNTLAGQLSSSWGKLRDQPTPARAAEFVKQYQDYANGVSKDAERVISDKYGRIIETNKKQLGPEHYQDLKDQYMGRFDQPAASPSMAAQGVDPVVLQYAKEYNITLQQAQSVKDQRMKEQMVQK